MSHQGEDNWYPECKICDCGNISEVVCLDCHNEKMKEQREELEKQREENTLDIYNALLDQRKRLEKEFEHISKINRERQREEIKQDLLKIADAGELEELRREVEFYF